jgi:hypothetical protein
MRAGQRPRWRNRRRTIVTQNSMHAARGALAVFFIVAALVSSAALAEPDDLTKLVAAPHDYLDKPVEIVGYCVKGGVKGDVLGYECTTEGTVYVNAGTIEPEVARQQIDENCKGEGHDPACRATIRFVPHSFSTSNVLEAGKSIIIFNTKKAELSF